jgi:acetylglutamate kinase
VLIKLGGNLLRNESVSYALAADFAELVARGFQPILVHGAGPQLTEALSAAGIENEFRDGYRYTSEAAARLMPDVLRERITEPLVALLRQHGVDAETLPEAPFRAQVKRDEQGEARWGRVGELRAAEDSINDPTFEQLLDAGKVPVVASLGHDATGTLNLNADDAAAALASALKVEKLLLLTDVAGIYSDWPNRDSLIRALSAAEARALLPKLETGMVPKLTAALTAIEGGVRSVAIFDGTVEHSILLELSSDTGVGTRIHP